MPRVTTSVASRSRRKRYSNLPRGIGAARASYCVPLKMPLENLYHMPIVIEELRKEILGVSGLLA